MFDMEKMMKPIFEKYIPSIVEAFERNKKKDYLMRVSLEKEVSGGGLTVEFLKLQSETYDRVHEKVSKELSQ